MTIDFRFPFPVCFPFPIFDSPVAPTKKGNSRGLAAKGYPTAGVPEGMPFDFPSNYGGTAGTGENPHRLAARFRQAHFGVADDQRKCRSERPGRFGPGVGHSRR